MYIKLTNLFIFLLFFSSFSLKGNVSDTLFVEMNLPASDTKEVEVSVRPQFKNIEKDCFIFFRNIKGVEKVIFDNITIDADTKIKQETVKNWWLKEGKKLKKMTYTLTPDKEEYASTPTLLKVENNQFYFIHLMGLIPQISTDKSYIVALKLNFNDNLVCPMLGKDNWVYFNNQFVVEQASIIVGDFQKEAIEIADNKIVDLFYYTDYQLIKLNDVVDVVEPIIKDVNEYIADIPLQNNQLFVTVFKNAKNANHTFWGGVANKNYTLVTLPAISKKTKFRKYFIKTLAHELLHSLVPFNLHTNKTFKSVQKNETYSKHLWLYEGVTEYLSWKLLFDKGYINFDDFCNEFGKKIAEGNRLKASLSSVSEHIHLNKNAENSDLFYNRGAVLGLLLDILIYEKFNGEKSLLSVLKEMSIKQKEFDESTFIANFEKFAHPTIGTYLRRVIDENQLKNPNQLLKKIGLNYFDYKQELVPSYGVLGIQPYMKKPYYRLYKAGRNTLGLQKGDAIIAVNNTYLTIRNGNEYLTPIQQAKMGDYVKLKVLRQGKIIELTGEPIQISMPFYNIIRPVKKTTDEALKLRKLLFNTDNSTYSD